MNEQSPGNNQHVSPPESLLPVCPPSFLSVCPPSFLSIYSPSFLSVCPLLVLPLVWARRGDEDQSEQLQRKHVDGGERAASPLRWFYGGGRSRGGLMTEAEAGPGSDCELSPQQQTDRKHFVMLLWGHFKRFRYRNRKQPFPALFVLTTNPDVTSKTPVWSPQTHLENVAASCYIIHVCCHKQGWKISPCLVENSRFLSPQTWLDILLTPHQKHPVKSPQTVRKSLDMKLI